MVWPSGHPVFEDNKSARDSLKNDQKPGMWKRKNKSNSCLEERTMRYSKQEATGNRRQGSVYHIKNKANVST